MTLFFPNGLQDALNRVDFKPYDAHALDVDYKVIGHRHLPKVATLIKLNEERKGATAETEGPPADGSHPSHFSTKPQDKAFLVPSYVKKATWLGFVSFRPLIPDYQRAQDVRLTQENPIDSLLKNAFYAAHITSIA